MVRLNDLILEESLSCVKSLKRANIPLCIVDAQLEGWSKLLNNIAFNEDLFIAAESITNIEMAYEAAANGAQFFILSNSDITLMDTLSSMGFFFIPTISNEQDQRNCLERGIECALYTCDIAPLLPSIKTYNSSIYPLKDGELFGIVDLPKDILDYELWMKALRKEQLGINYVEITTDNQLSESLNEFVELFSIMHKCKITHKKSKNIIIETRDLIRMVNDLKWDAVYFDPDDTIMENGELKEVKLDKELNGFRLILRSVK